MHEMRDKRKLILLISTLLLAVTLAAGVYLFQSRQHMQAEQASLLLEEGITQFRQEEYEKALKTLQAVPEEMVNDWRLPYYTGSVLITLKDYQGAVAQLERALELNSGEKNVLFALGVAYYKLGNLSLSKGYFASVLEIDPGHQEAKGLMDIMARLERYSADQDQKIEN